MINLDTFYSDRINKFDRDINRLERAIRSSTVKISKASPTHPRTARWDKSLKRQQQALLNKKYDKDKFIENKQLIDSFGVTEGSGNTWDRAWIATIDPPEKTKPSKGYFCITNKWNLKYWSNQNTIDAIRVGDSRLNSFEFLYGKKILIKGFGEVYFDAKFVIKDKTWVDDSVDPLLFFNMNNKSVREYLVFFSKIKDKFDGTSPYWIDNYLFLF